MEKKIYIIDGTFSASVEAESEESAKKFGQVYECALGVLACSDSNDFCSYGVRKSES